MTFVWHALRSNDEYLQLFRTPEGEQWVTQTRRRVTDAIARLEKAEFKPFDVVRLLTSLFYGGVSPMRMWYFNLRNVTVLEWKKTLSLTHVFFEVFADDRVAESLGSVTTEIQSFVKDVERFILDDFVRPTKSPKDNDTIYRAVYDVNTTNITKTLQVISQLTLATP